MGTSRTRSVFRVNFSNQITHLHLAEACDNVTYSYLQTLFRYSPAFSNDDGRRSPSRASSIELSDIEVGEATFSTHDDAGAADEGEDDEEGQKDNADTMKLIFRSAITKPITLTVRPTTKCSTILQVFLKRHNLNAKYPPTKGKKRGKSGPALVVDGDKLDPESEISLADLEDGDMVEVVGL